MLRLSNRGRYAVRAVFDLAFHARGGAGGAGGSSAADRPAQVRDVADRQRIPLRFLEQIFQELKRAGLVESKRGPRGGFRLTRAPEDVRLGDVLRAVEGPVSLAPAASTKKRDRLEASDMRDVADSFLADVGRSVERCFDVVTLGDLCARGEELGLREPATGPAASPPRWVI